MLANLAISRSYWLLVLLITVSMEAIALYFQYVLDYGPCVLCIHIRILLAALIPVCILALLITGSKFGRVLCHFSTLAIAAVMTERSWQLLGVERGFIDGSCSMESGLPDWLAFEKWWPEIFEIWEPCGYTPELVMGITMAEALIAFSGIFFVISLLLFIKSLSKTTDVQW